MPIYTPSSEAQIAARNPNAPSAGARLQGEQCVALGIVSAQLAEVIRLLGRDAPPMHLSADDEYALRSR